MLRAHVGRRGGQRRVVQRSRGGLRAPLGGSAPRWQAAGGRREAASTQVYQRCAIHGAQKVLLLAQALQHRYCSALPQQRCNMLHTLHPAPQVLSRRP